MKSGEWTRQADPSVPVERPTARFRTAAPILWFIGGLFAMVSFVSFVSAWNMSPELSVAYDYEANVETFCDQAMSNAALSSERHLARAVCDVLKAQAKAKIDAAREKMWMPLSAKEGRDAGIASFEFNASTKTVEVGAPTH